MRKFKSLKIFQPSNRKINDIFKTFLKKNLINLIKSCWNVKNSSFSLNKF